MSRPLHTDEDVRKLVIARTRKAKERDAAERQRGMTYLGNRTIRLTQAEYNALPEWCFRNGTTLVEDAMFRAEGTGGREPKIVTIIRTPPMFDLREAWYHAEIAQE